MEDTDIYLYLASLVRENLCAANYGRWPETEADWHEVATRLGVAVAVVPGFSGGACILGGLLIHKPGAAIEVARYYAHELAEERLRSECEAPFVVGFDAHHAVATLVEPAPTLLALRSRVSFD